MGETSPANSQLVISRLAEFADKHAELFFLRYELTESARFVRPLTLILASVYILFAVPDWFLIRDAKLFAWILLIRLIVAFSIIVLYLVVSRGTSYRVYPWLLTVCEMLASTGFVLILVNYPAPDFRIHTFWASLLIWSFVLVPNRWLYIVFASIYTGVIFLGMAVYYLSPLNPSHFSAAIYFMTLSIGLAAVSSHRMNSYKRSTYAALQALAKLSETDGLTGLYNRSGFDRRLREEMANPTYFSRSLALIMIDLDDFKKINDRWGHQYGDTVLVALANHLKEVVPPEGTLARWGGEEFVVLLPGYDLDRASQTAEKLRKHLAEQRYPHGTGVTASIGVAVAEYGETCESLLRRADELLYLAKAAGKNRIISERTVMATELAKTP
ncbi:MAG: GGDEF domain-containing protein [Firmicutes bacterium]|nr:GGDEF domain-containing protein [Bacillota bacterium]